jgi:hypothetical protein
MQVELEDHAASVLKDGNVLVSGGCTDDGDPSATAELYNSSIETFKSCDTIKNPQLSHKTFVLTNEKRPAIDESNPKTINDRQLY